MRLLNKKTILISLIFVIGLGLFSINPPQTYESSRETVALDLNDDLLDVEERLAEIKKQKQDLEAAINQQNALQSKYGTEIANLSYQISIMMASVQELELEIEKSIVEKEENIAELEEKTTKTLTDMYLNSKSYSEVYMLFDPLNSDQYIKSDLYNKAVQEDTQSDLVELANQREELEQEKVQLGEDKIQIEKDKTLVDEQKIALEKEQTKLNQQKAYLDTKMRESLSVEQQYEIAYQNSSAEEQELLAQQEYLRQKIFEEIGSIPSGSRVLRGTIIGFEGNTGWSTGPHLHFGVAHNGTTINPCNYLNCPALTGAELDWPISPQGVITSYYGWRTYDFHAAIDISTGGNGVILAAHDGWVTYGTQECWDLSWVKCNGGYAKYAIICEDRNNCNNGFKTLYWHLK